MTALEDLPADVPVAHACREMGVSRATLYRHTSPPTPPKPRFSQPARTLSTDEVATLHRVLHKERFVDQPPAEIFAQLLSEGTYIASIRTMYRYLGRWGEVHERRNQRSGGPHAMPSLTASAPNQIWTWDITKLAGP
jgi:transposase InsO family protein